MEQMMNKSTAETLSGGFNAARLPTRPGGV